MISVAAIRMQQFGVQFYQASLTANDIDKLVRFEVLSYGEQAHAPVRGGKKPPQQSKIRWDLLERRIASSEKAYQRQIIRRKIDELVQYYEQCRVRRAICRPFPARSSSPPTRSSRSSRSRRAARSAG